jgi:predicted  nucleic acid-binding Zn-ribbon protein
MQQLQVRCCLTNSAESLDVVTLFVPIATDAFETETVASLREKVKKLEKDLKNARAEGGAGTVAASEHGSDAGSSAEIASLSADLSAAHKLRKEREDELVAMKKQVAELTSELKKASKFTSC